MHTKIPKKDQTQNLHKRWEVHKTMNQQQPNHRLRVDSSLSHWGLKCILLGQIFALDSDVVIKVA